MRRRDFLRNGVPMAVLPALFGSIGVKAFGKTSMIDSLLKVTGTDNDHVLVLVQLFGGNDGLNTVIPLDMFSRYNNARPNIAIPEASVLRLDGTLKTGLHPSLTGLRDLYNNGKLAILQSVGMPDPTYSHFRASDIWESGSDSTQTLNTGWAGRYLNYEYPNYPVGYPNTTVTDPLAVQIGAANSFALQGPAMPMGINIEDPSNVYNLTNGFTDVLPAVHAGTELNFIRTIAQQTQTYSQVISAASNAVTQQSVYPADNYLAEQLKIVARLIKGGLKTRVYMVSYDGFDTHSSQVEAGASTTGKHAVLLKTVGDAIKAFQTDLQYLGIEDKVMGMTFSEFGRRIKSNDSSGTDHGAAAPLFVFGKKVQGGILGDSPDIPASVTDEDNVPMQIDFRSVYSSLLQDWMCVPPQDLNGMLLRNYQALPLMQQNACRQCTVNGNRPVYQQSGISLISNSPNPFVSSTTITYTTQGMHTMVQVMNTSGKVIKVLVDKVMKQGTYTVSFDSTNYPPGTYYLRLQNMELSQVKAMMIVAP
ncbi:MAG: DUF1501 domain-containing protein [Chitinophagaceae bacterium]|nr:DUF1501 domain-containing protein [Chitinophagaceae bacterium]